MTGRPLNRGVGKGSLAYADGLLNTRGENGVMGLVEAMPDAHRRISRFTPPRGRGLALADPKRASIVGHGLRPIGRVKERTGKHQAKGNTVFH